jgi:hypothetical protein
MIWYFWATTVVILISLAARRLTSHATLNDRWLGQGEPLAAPAWYCARSGIHDETYRRRIM